MAGGDRALVVGGLTGQVYRAGGMGDRSAIVAFVVGFAGATALGVVLRDPFQIGAGVVGVGILAAFVSRGRSAAGGLAIGIVVSLPVVLAVFLIGGDDVGEVLGVLPIIIGVWVVYVVAGLAGFAASSFARRSIEDRRDRTTAS